MPDKAHLLLYQGDDYSGVVTVAYGDLPPDLTGYTAKAQIRAGPADGNSAVIVEITTSITQNLVHLTIPRQVTVGLNKPLYYWDLHLIAPDGKTVTILAGNVIVTPEITR